MESHIVVEARFSLNMLYIVMKKGEIYPSVYIYIF